MYDPKYNKESRGMYQISGAIGCLPSLVFCIAGFALTSGFYRMPNTGMLFMSFIFGVGGVAGLFAAASMRRKEDRVRRTKEPKQYLDEE